MLLDKILMGMDGMIGEVWMVSLSEVYGWVGDSSIGMG